MPLQETSRTLLQLISDVIAQEFIESKEFGVCFLAALVFSEQVKKFGFKSVVKCGRLDNGLIQWPVHFWTEVEGEIFDPTISITSAILPVAETKYYENQQRPQTPDDFLMLEIYNKFKKKKSGKIYFKMFPQEAAIRWRIDKKINDIFGF